METVSIDVKRQNNNEYLINPYRQITKIGDPFILYDEGTLKYYMYCTGGYFKCWSSSTLKTWESEGDAYVKTENSFGTQKYWAPEVYKHDGVYYMVYSAANAENRHSIGIAKSDSPTGPFKDMIKGPLLSPGYNIIDANLLFDDDGKIYLYYARDNSENYIDGKRTSQIYGVELSSSLTEVIGTPLLLSTPSQNWEYKSGSVIWNEGPCVFKNNGTYYLLYSANYYSTAHYSVGYSTSSSPLGTYEKYKNNPILAGDGVYTSGTGHCNITRSPDGSEIYIVYHSQTDIKNPSADRTPCYDKLIIRDDGTLAVNGPSFTRQPLPSGANGLYKIYDGIEITSTYKKLSGDVKSLIDEKVLFKGFSAPDLYSFEYSEDGYIELKYDRSINLNSLWIYGINAAMLSPGSVYAVINDTYKTEIMPFSDIIPLSPIVITGSSLPEGTLVNNIKLCFGLFDDKAESIYLSEFITVEQR